MAVFGSRQKVLSKFRNGSIASPNATTFAHMATQFDDLPAGGLDSSSREGRQLPGFRFAMGQRVEKGASA
jgi:hypothetical protein